MLTAFELDGQRYDRTGFYYAETKDGRRVKLHVFQADCADCGTPFAFGVKGKIDPTKWVKRRCKGCRTVGGNGRRVVGNEGLDIHLTAPVTVPMTRRKAMRNGDALMEPHNAPLGNEARSIDRRPAAPPEQGLMSDG